MTNEKTFLRKFNEAILAIQLERKYEKDEILEMYFNFVYFGRGAYGIQAAAQSYFGINVQDLNVQQGATLIGILKAPSKYAPHLNMENSVRRRNTVLAQMKKYGYISEEKYNEYCNEQIEIIEKISLPDYGFYTDYVLEASAKELGISVSDLLAGGYKIYTSQDSLIQNELQKIYDDTSNFPEGNIDEIIQSSTVILDNSKGSVCAIIGGREHEAMRVFNRATAKRQPGSCIKPLLVYAPAFENKSITPLTVFDDFRKDFNGYYPTNYKDVYYGNVTVRKALSLSLNIPAVELLAKNGVEYSKKYAEASGIVFDSEDNHLALALGGMKYGCSPLEIAGAYSVFARKGEYIEPWCIEKITDNEDAVLYQHIDNKVRVFNESTAYLITDILCDVSEHENNGLNSLNKSIACKTGTVGYNEKGHSDAWSASYVNSHTVCVWMGYDRTDSEHYLSREITGSSYPTQISAEIYKFIFDKYGYNDFSKPDSVVMKPIDLLSLKNENKIYVANENVPSANIIYEYFDIENVPYESNKYWNVPELPDNITVNLNELRKAEISFIAKEPYVEYIIYKKDGDNDIEFKRISALKNERIVITDENYTEGDCYVFQAIHKEIMINGSHLSGKKSKEYNVH